MSGVIKTDSNQTEFIAGPNSKSLIQVPLSRGHHRNNIYGEDKWIHIISCTVKSVTSDSVQLKMDKPACFFQTFPPEKQNKTGHIQKKRLKSFPRLLEGKRMNKNE